MTHSRAVIEVGSDRKAEVANVNEGNVNYVFISYSRPDAKIARRLVSRLEASGIRLWIDEQQLEAGDSLLDRIQSAIDKAAFFIVLLSPKSVGSRWVQEELKLALTRQMNGREKFIIPIVVQTCELPHFLRDRVYIDFSNRRRFEIDANKLLRSIDLEIAVTSGDRSRTRFPDEIAVERMARTKGLGDDEWFRMFRELPLVVECARAVQNGSFGGSFRSTLSGALAFASNQEGGLHFNNLCALLGFLSDVSDIILTRRDLQGLYKELVEDMSIGTDYRSFVLGRLTSAAAKIHDRYDRLAMLPSIFPLSGFDPMANKLLVEFFESDQEQLSDLWRIAPAYYRERIMRYALRVGKWDRMPLTNESAILRDECRTALGSARARWRGIGVLEPGAGELQNLVEQLTESAASGSIDAVLEVMERLSATRDPRALDAMADLCIGGNASRIRDARGSQFIYDLSTRIVYSPYIEATIKTISFMSMFERFGDGCLGYHDAFPNSLMRRSEQGLFGKLSVIDGLIAQLDSNEDDKAPLIILVSVIRTYQNAPYLLAFISLAIERVDKPNPTLVAVRAMLHGELSIGDLTAKFL